MTLAGPPAYTHRRRIGVLMRSWQFGTPTKSAWVFGGLVLENQSPSNMIRWTKTRFVLGS